MCNDKDAWGRPMFPPYVSTNKSGDTTNYQSSEEVTDNGYTPEPTKEYNEKGIVEETEERVHDEQRLAEIREAMGEDHPWTGYFKKSGKCYNDLRFLLTLLDEARGETYTTSELQPDGSTLVTLHGDTFVEEPEFSKALAEEYESTPVELHLQGTVESLRRQLAEAKQTIGIQASTIVGLTEELHEVKVSNDSVKGIKSEVTRLKAELAEAKDANNRLQWRDDNGHYMRMNGEVWDCKIMDSTLTSLKSEVARLTFLMNDARDDAHHWLEEVTRLRGALEKIASGDTTPEDFCLCGIPNRKCECADAIAEEALATKSEGGKG